MGDMMSGGCCGLGGASQDSFPNSLLDDMLFADFWSSGLALVISEAI